MLFPIANSPDNVVVPNEVVPDVEVNEVFAVRVVNTPDPGVLEPILPGD